MRIFYCLPHCQRRTSHTKLVNFFFLNIIETKMKKNNFCSAIDTHMMETNLAKNGDVLVKSDIGTILNKTRPLKFVIEITTGN